MNNSMDALKSKHQQRVELFIGMMGIGLPDKPVDTLSDDLRLLSAELIFEEAFETINALGVELVVDADDRMRPTLTGNFNPIETIDGVCDLIYVSTFCAALFGIPVDMFQELVDSNNLLKFTNGPDRDENGKQRKPENHPKPEIKRLFNALTKN